MNVICNPGRSYVFGLSYVLLMIFSACEYGIPQRPSHVVISDSPVFKSQSPDDVKNAEQGIRVIISIARESSILPVITPVHLYLYKNKASMAFYGYGWNTLPIDIHGVAFAQGASIHINSEMMPQSGFGIVKILAHEYAHLVENQINGNNRVTRYWFNEGFAEWVTAKLLEILNWQASNITEEKTREELFAIQNEVPRFDSPQLDEFWRSTLSKPKGSVKTYGTAFIAVSALLKTHGFEAAVKYIRTGDFTNSFGLDEDVFATHIDATIRTSQHQRIGKERISLAKPTWRTGDKWTYIEKRPGGETATRVRQITKESSLNGVPTFIVETSNGEIIYSKDTFGAVGAMKSGKLILTSDKPDQTMLWPLEVGMSWQNEFSLRNMLLNSTTRVTRHMSVVSEDVITVPAGSFNALKINSFDPKSGELIAEYWYSPAIKWFVKSRYYSVDAGMSEEELIRFTDGNTRGAGVTH